MAVLISFIVYQSATPTATPGHNDSNELPDVYIGIGISLCIVVIFLILILLLILIIRIRKKIVKRKTQGEYEDTLSREEYAILIYGILLIFV